VGWDPDRSFESDHDESRRRWRNLAVAAGPALLAAALVLALGLPWWVVALALALFVLVIITNS
jgi:fatty acid desaturase